MASGENIVGTFVILLIAPFLVFLSFAGIGYNYYMTEDFPESCIQLSPCYFGLLLPAMVPVFVVFMYCNWMGHKLFIHN